MKTVTCTSTDQIVCVELEHIGEGFSGDYDPKESVLRREDGEWNPVSDGSFCTNIVATTKPEQLKLYAHQILAAVEADVKAGRSIKSTCEKLSWLPQRWSSSSSSSSSSTT